jgi:predicted nucleic acid-binding protein
MNGGKAFFDTNVLIYLHSTSEPRKQARARQLFAQFVDNDGLLLSTQVIQEFFVAGRKKLKLPTPTLRRLVEDLLRFPLVAIGPSHILRAITGQDDFKISFWDALIVAAAEDGGADIVFTEDLNHGQQYGSVTAFNPFLSDQQSLA